MPALKWNDEVQKMADVLAHALVTGDFADPDEGFQVFFELHNEHDSDDTEFWSSFSFYHLPQFVQDWHDICDDDRISAYVMACFTLTQSKDPYIHRYFRESPDAYVTLERILHREFFLTIPPTSHWREMGSSAENDLYMWRMYAVALRSIVENCAQLPVPFVPSAALSSTMRAVVAQCNDPVPRGVKTEDFSQFWYYVLQLYAAVEQRRDLLDQIPPHPMQTVQVWSQCRLEECEVKNNLSVCSRCQSVRYCSTEHQTSDWKEHKKICKKPIW